MAALPYMATFMKTQQFITLNPNIGHSSFIVYYESFMTNENCSIYACNVNLRMGQYVHDICGVWLEPAVSLLMTLDPI